MTQIDLTSWKNALMLFLILQWKKVSCRFVTSIFNSPIYWRKEIRKDKFVFVLTRWWTASGAREICKTEWEWGEIRPKEREEYEERRDAFYAEHERQWETQTKQLCDQKPLFTYRIQPLKDTWRPSMVTNWDKPVVTMEWWWHNIQNSRSFQKQI